MKKITGIDENGNVGDDGMYQAGPLKVKIGDIVRVYRDPQTQIVLEGEARVMRVCSDAGKCDGVPYVRAMVVFLEDGDDARPVDRIIEGSK